MADKVIGVKLEADTSSATTNVKNFKQEVKLAEQAVVDMSAQFGSTSKQAAEAAKKAAELKDQIGDAKSLVDAFNPDTKFKAFSASINTVVGGFSALQGVMGLVGVESEETEKLLLKVQSALAISQGWAQVQEGLQTFKNLGAVIQSTTIFQKANAVATNLAAGATRLLGISASTSATGFQVLKGAIVATGIGALVIGVTLLVQALSSMADETDEAAEAQKRLDTALENVNNSLNSQINFLDREQKLQVARAKARGASEEEIFNLEQSFRSKNLKAKEEAYQKISDLQGTVDFKALETIKDQHAAIELAELDFSAKQLDRQKQAAAKAAAQAKELRQQALKEAEQENEQRLKNFTASGGPGGGLDIGVPKTAEQLQIEATLEAAKIASLEKDKLREDESAKEAEALNEKRDNAYNQMLLDQLVFENRQRYADATSNVLKSLSALVGQQTTAGKVLAIAAATIDTYQAVVATLKNAAKTPAGGIPGYAIAQAIATGIFGLATVAKIASTKVPGGGGGSAPNLSLNAPITPQRAERQTTTLDQQSLNALGSATTRAFVVESDITSNQEKITRLNRAARLGG